ncbi:MAG: alpha/beta hydrolase [Muribaculaceae bacterium]|nr:alpha/beta hydrolase [Muribaculaceae bacterium]
MKNFLMTVALAATALCVNAIKPVTVDLRPENSEPEEKATLEVYLPEKCDTRGAVVMCPGGGYGFVSVENEGRNWVEWFTDRGIATAVLVYRLPRQRHTVPLADCTAAIECVRQNSAKWGIPSGHTGVMGFSAGGHLASTMATHYGESSRPDFQILIYPVITMDKAITHMGTHDSLIGTEPSTALETLYSNELQVTPQTPPAFIFTCEDDDVVHPDNSIRYYQALTANKVPSELHIYPTGGHGFGFNPRFTYHNQMLWLLESWFNTTVFK